METTSPVLVLGIGNPILSDDGIGPRLIDDLKTSFKPNRFTFRTGTVGGLEILDMINGFSDVIFIDAIKTSGGVPGTIYQLSPENFIETLHLTNLHDINFLQAIELGRKLELPVPGRILILAIEIVEDLEFSEQFSEPVRIRYPEILQEVKRFLEEYPEHPE